MNDSGKREQRPGDQQRDQTPTTPPRPPARGAAAGAAGYFHPTSLHQRDRVGQQRAGAGDVDRVAS